MAVRTTTADAIAGLRRRLPGRPDAKRVAGSVVLLVVLAAALVLFLSWSTTYDLWGVIWLGPALFLVSLPVLAHAATRMGDPRLFWFLSSALLVKLFASVIRYQAEIGLYGDLFDAGLYHESGVQLSERFAAGNFDTGFPSLTGTYFIRFFTGVVYTLIGRSEVGGFLVYAWLGFWGLFFFYRAFVIAVPEGRARSYAWLVFFLPSLLFWSSATGKDAWMIFALGIAAFGCARLLAGATVSGLVIAGGGLWLAALVRPHVAGMVCLGLVAAYLVRRPPENARMLASVAKLVGLAVAAAAAFALVVNTVHFLQQSDIETGKGLTAALEDTAELGDEGGSEFAPKLVNSPLDVPAAAVTILFRPLLFEAHNPQAIVAGIETTFLLLLTVIRLPWIFTAIRSMRRQPYIALAVVYIGLFVVAFSAMSNFGLLARERVQLFPLYLVLLCVPPPRRRQMELAKERARTENFQPRDQAVSVMRAEARVGTRGRSGD